METTKIYLVRHAQSVGNMNRVFQGRIDEALSPEGLSRLEALRDFFSRIKLDALYSSPLRRARDTADAVNSGKNLPICLLPDMIEIKGGGFEGRHWDELPELFPEEMKLWDECIGRFTAPDGESAHQVYERAVRTLYSVIAQNKGRTAAIVSHGFVIRCCMCYAAKLPCERLGEVGWLANAGHILLTVDAESGEIISADFPQSRSPLDDEGEITV